MARPGKASHGLAWLARRGEARRGLACQGMARRGWRDLKVNDKSDPLDIYSSPPGLLFSWGNTAKCPTSRPWFWHQTPPA